jgi:hypothetical protein
MIKWRTEREREKDWKSSSTFSSIRYAVHVITPRKLQMQTRWPITALLSFALCLKWPDDSSSSRLENERSNNGHSSSTYVTTRREEEEEERIKLPFTKTRLFLSVWTSMCTESRLFDHRLHFGLTVYMHPIICCWKGSTGEQWMLFEEREWGKIRVSLEWIIIKNTSISIHMKDESE